MADPSQSISELKIDRSAPPPATGNGRWIALGLGAVGLAIVWWIVAGSGSGATLVETDIARKPPSVAAANSVLDASGYVVARRQATVSSKVTGKVRDIFVEEGMRVEKDQVVATLDDTTEQARLTLAMAQAKSSRATLAEFEAQLRNARLNRNRLRDLAAQNLASKSSLDSAEALFDELSARLQTGRENIEVADAHSPLDDMDDEHFLASMLAYTEGTLQVMSDESTQWGQSIRTPKGIQAYIDEAKEKAAAVGGDANASAEDETDSSASDSGSAG